MTDQLYGLITESEELEVAGAVRDPQELRGGNARADEVDAIIVHDRKGSVPLLELTRELSTNQPELGLVLIVGDSGPEVLRAGMQAGARDVISQPVGLEALEMSVMAAAAWTQALRRRAARDTGDLRGVGRVVTVVGAKGGVGTTTVAVHMALAARQLRTASVCLIEYDLQAGDIRSFLDLPHRRSVADLVTVADELTTRNLQESLFTHQSGMRVLFGPEHGEQADEVTASAARNIITAIRTREDLTVIDAGTTLTEASAIAIEMADTVVVVSTPDVVSLRGVTRAKELWDRLKVEPPAVAVLLNQTSRRHEIQPDLARRVVASPVLETTVPSDFWALEPAVNTGIPDAGAASQTLLSPMASVLAEISALSSEDAEKSDVDRRASLAARLAGESGQAVVEFVGVLPVLLIVIVAVWQIVLVGATFVFASHAARAGAAAFAVGDPVVSAAEKGMPPGWKSGVKVTDANPGDTGPDGQKLPTDIGSVQVTDQVPILFPGSGLGIPITSHATTPIEDQLLQGESNPITTTSLGDVGGGFAATAAGMPKIKPPALIPGNKAQLQPNGDAAAPRSAPKSVQQMIGAANAIDRYPYCWGGGHGPGFIPTPGLGSGDSVASHDCHAPKVGYDCSGSTSFVLGAVHQLAAPQTSGYFGGWGAPGPGKWVTIYSTGDHVHMVIAGLDFNTDLPPENGPRWGNPGADMSGYTESH
ncbi:MAG: AAA family ATPase, partial [Solirubrobacterales bacterium]|nr:AAA family ATPase [Solirubrobacterales bacterium]